MLDRRTIENLYYLFNAPERLSFPSLEEERIFWAREEICEQVDPPKNPTDIDYGMPEKEVLPAIWSGKVDLIRDIGGDCVEPGPRYIGYRLREEFSKHAERVRLIDNLFWAHQLRPS